MAAVKSFLSTSPLSTTKEMCVPTDKIPGLSPSKFCCIGTSLPSRLLAKTLICLSTNCWSSSSAIDLVEVSLHSFLCNHLFKSPTLPSSIGKMAISVIKLLGLVQSPKTGKRLMSMLISLMNSILLISKLKRVNMSVCAF